MDSFFPTQVQKNLTIEMLQNILAENGQHFPLFLQEASCENTAKQILAKKWAAFHPVKMKDQNTAKNSRGKMGNISPVGIRNCKVKALKENLAEKWAAFPPVFTRK